MNARKHVAPKRLGLATVATLLVALAWFIARDPDQVSDLEPDPASVETVRSRRLEHPAAESDAREPVTSGQAAELDSIDDCAWFDPWSRERVSRESVARLFRSIRPLDEHAIACLPASWLYGAALLDCESGIVFDSQDSAIFAVALAKAAPTISDGLAETAILPTDTENLNCLLEALLESGASERDVGRACGALLMKMFGDRGSFLSADPEVVEALRLVLARLPVNSDAWWEGVWQGMPLDSLDAALNVRLALYEALALMLPGDEWTHRLSRLAVLEPRNGLTSTSMAMCIGRTLPLSDYASLLAASSDAYWTQTLFHAVLDSARWPFGDAAVPQSLIDELRALQGSADYPFRIEITLGQWELFGPRLASEDFAEFVASSDRTDPRWATRAGAQVAGALRALSYSATPASDAPYLEQARTLVRELLLSGDPRDTTRAIECLRGSFNLQSKDSARLAELLGPEGLEALDAESRDWLDPD